MPKKSDVSIYARIALDIATRIAHGEFPEGSRISGRSLTAGSYNVSPETIRRAFSLLVDDGVLDVMQGSGAVVLSRDKAMEHVEKRNIFKDGADLRKELKELRKQRLQLDKRIDQIYDELADHSERFRHSSNLYTYEYEVWSDSLLCGCSLIESGFRKNTGGTIVAVKRSGDLMLSPDPEFVLKSSDTIVVAGDYEIIKRVEAFLHKNRISS